MRPLRSSRRGLSEIVGALMLVLIVVSAATVFAVFAAGYQKQLEAQQTAQQNRNLESLGILRATPTPASNGVDWSTVNITVASLYINPATVTEITINDDPLEQYSAVSLNLTTGAFQSITIGAGGQLQLGPREQLNIIVNCTQGTSNYSFYASSGFVLPTTDYVKIELFTALQNIFTRVFIPPTAIAFVGTIQTSNGTGFTNLPLLDGSQSFQPVNGTLIAWSWSVFPDNSSAQGERTLFTFNPAFLVHHVTLTVTNSDGFLGTTTILYP